jgi:predicted PurR-regulated permease PerM
VQPITVGDDLARRVLTILFIVALIAICIWILSPFLPATIWATTLVVATWSIMSKLQTKLWGKRWLAVISMTIFLLLVFVIPFWMAIGTIVANSGQIIDWTTSVTSIDLSVPPVWATDLPVIADAIARAWTRIFDSGAREVLQEVRPYVGMLIQWFISAVGSLGIVLMQFLLTVVMAAILYARGEHAARAATGFGFRLAGDRGRQAVKLAGQAIRSVALGVVGTAFVQAGIGTFGLLVTGVPFASVLSAVLFMLCIAQLGPALILVPSVVWMYWSDQTVAATILLIISLVAIGIDNVVRPILIRKGVDLPLLLILAGVIGGLIAFGLIGIFLGPTVLAVGYTLLNAWMSEIDQTQVV